MGSLAVAVLTCDSVIGDVASFSNSNMVSPGSGTAVGASGRGSLLNRSAALALCGPGLYLMV